MNGFSKRNVVVYDLPTSDDIEILHPEQAMVRFGGKKTVDLGALCYFRRDKSPRRRNQGMSVDLGSYSSLRADQVRKLLQYISENFITSGNRWTTMFECSSNFMHFMDFVDHMGYENVLGDSDVARIAFARYVEFLWERVRSNQISEKTACCLQAAPHRILCGFFDLDNLAEGLNLLRGNQKTVENTLPPCEMAQSKVLALCEAIFFGFSDLALNNRPYPYRLNMPEYLDWENKYLWVFPTIVKYMTPFNLAKRKQLKRPFWAYDYVNGCLNNLESIKKYYTTENSAKIALVRSQEYISRANNDPRCYARISAAINAMKAFIVLFTANVAMNISQIVSLPWSDKYSIGVERQGFRTVKWRAAGRKCSFEIQSTFLPAFKTFLLLRKYILGDKDFQTIFFSFGSGRVSGPLPLSRNISYLFFGTLRQIDPHVPKVTPREWRAAKGDWLIRNTDISTAAQVLQNSEKTLLKHYAAGSETVHMEEMSTFFVGITETVKNRGVSVEGVAQAIGTCSSFGAPQQIAFNTPIAPSCRGFEGCLFCDKFRIHADDLDTKKLLSCRYCLRKTAHFAEKEEQYQRVFTPTFNRIDEILKEIDMREPGLVEKIRVQVEEYGELDTYWSGKLEMLVSLGIVIC